MQRQVIAWRMMIIGQFAEHLVVEELTQINVHLQNRASNQRRPIVDTAYLLYTFRPQVLC